jgi:hypothetical protein
MLYHLERKVKVMNATVSKIDNIISIVAPAHDMAESMQYITLNKDIIFIISNMKNITIDKDCVFIEESDGNSEYHYHNDIIKEIDKYCNKSARKHIKNFLSKEVENV